VSIRQPDHDIERVFVERWSPRAFTDDEIPDATLLRCFEAARWAPSGFNLQPWRFIYAKRGAPGWDVFLSLLTSSNLPWASNAAALILFASETVATWDGVEMKATSHSFDTGAAWSNFAHQAHLLGWHTHAIGGFDFNLARTSLGIPDRFAIETLVAIGRQGAPDTLPPKLAAREKPSARRPILESIMEGRFRTA
jgi:nitroreductase